ncbi:DUF2207 domain-containing protein [Sphaerimonospora cavernae]|uniref:DUF2207 domain-containing protein n=1 Tax=Sphaerimonospora cavernae TaxID=1740611 RepID=A0ABV6U851_9ACTN
MMDVARQLRLAVLLAVLAALAALGPAAAPASASADRGTTVADDDVVMELGKNGVLHVKETITLSGGPLKRTLLTRTRYDDGHDRLYQIANVKGATFDGETLTVKESGTVEYDVTGAVTPVATGEELRWFAVAGPVRNATVRVTGPGRVQNLTCFAGEPTSAMACTAASTDEAGTTAAFEHQGLVAGQTLTVIVGYPTGATGAAPILERRFELSNAFALNTVTVLSLVALLVLLLGGVGLLYWARGRDARIIGGEPGEVSGHQSGHFTPPDGVRPGQIGTLFDEHADVIDVTATIVDLAVRGYLRIDEQPRQTYETPDWRLVRLPRAPLGSLLPYERALHNAIFDGRDEVALSRLRGSFAAELDKVRDALYQDVVTQGWFARRPDSVRTRWTTAGVIVIVLGMATTALLAWLTTYGLLGLAVIIAGAALAYGGQFMPAKTAKGAAALARVLGFREHLATGGIDDVPAVKRIELFSRYLPYAVIFDSVDRWARVVSTGDGVAGQYGTGNGHRADNLYWYEGPAEWDLSRFADSMRTFTMTTSGAISAARHARSQ